MTSSDRKEVGEEERETFLHSDLNQNDERFAAKSTWKENAKRWLRLVIELGMAITILILLVRPNVTSAAKRSPVPTFAKKPTKFLPNKKYLHEKMFENNHTTLMTLHNWIDLSALGRGYVVIPDADRYDLGKPYTVEVSRHQDGPGYMVSVFHQLHCLSYLVEHFQMGYGGMNLTAEVAEHTAHCFDYLRQGIMCAADTSLEGSTEAGPGWGSEHMCTDYEALLEWTNEHGAASYRNSLIPVEEDIL